MKTLKLVLSSESLKILLLPSEVIAAMTNNVTLKNSLEMSFFVVIINTQNVHLFKTTNIHKFLKEQQTEGRKP